MKIISDAFKGLRRLIETANQLRPNAVRSITIHRCQTCGCNYLVENGHKCRGKK